MSITNRKSHTGFRMVPTSVTLNKLELRNSPYFALFHRMFYFACCMNIIFNSLLAQLVKYDVHTTRKIKSIHAIFITIILRVSLDAVTWWVLFSSDTDECGPSISVNE